MVRTKVQQTKKKRKALRTSSPPKKKHSPEGPDLTKFYNINEVPKWVEDPAGECLMHTTHVIRARVAHRVQTAVDGLGY